MNIVYVSNNFSDPDQPGSSRPWEVVQFLKQQGHQITLITNRRHYLDERLKIQSQNRKEGLQIVAVNTSSGRRKSLFGRLLNYLSFSLKVFSRIRRLTEIDVLIVGTPPPLLPFFAWLASRDKKTYFILEIKDLYPESAVALNMASPSVAFGIWGLLEKWVRRRADHIVTVVPGFKEKLLEDGIASEDISTIPNGFQDRPKGNFPLPGEIQNLLDKYSGDLKIIYTGAMGYANELGTILKAAEKLKNRKVIFILIGEGERKKEYQEYVDRHELDRCKILPLLSHRETIQLLRQCDIATHSLPAHPYWKHALSNKIFDYMGNEKPVIFAGEGHIKSMIEDSEGGLAVPPNNPEEYSKAVQYFMDNPERVKECGKNAREFILANYFRPTLFHKWEDALKGADPPAAITDSSG